MLLDWGNTMERRAAAAALAHLDIRAEDPKNRRFRPCLLYNIEQCTAPCGNRISKEAYRADIDRFTRFLTSKRSAMLRAEQGEESRR